MELEQIIGQIYNKSIFFKGIEKDEIRQMLQDSHYQIKTYGKNGIIADELSPCHSIGIVLKGNVEIKKIYSSGKVVTLASLGEGSIFGEVIIFSDMQRYPSHVHATTATEVLYISKEDLELLCHDHKIFMTNVLTLLSNRILMLNRKISFLSYNTLRQKIAHYLLGEYKKKKSLMFTLPVSRKMMAEQLGVPRPSLSREFMKLKDEGIIDYESKAIKIIDLQLLESCLFN